MLSKVQTRSSASVTAQRPAFAIGVPPDICAFHRYTRNSSLPYSTQVMPVSPARPKLSPGISQTTRQTTYELFTPSNSGQRLHPTYYRGCWHVVSRDLLVRYRHRMNSYSHSCSSLTTEFYDPKTFFTHAALLHQTCVHCGRFPTAASRRSMDRVSVPLWPISLSGRIPVAALVGHYPTNKLIGRRLIPHRKSFPPHHPRCGPIWY